jgi:hypothetical protein
MKRSLLCAINLLTVFTGLRQPVLGREPEPAPSTVPVLPAGNEIAELARLRLLSDLTPRLQRFSPTERRSIYLAIAVERGLLTSAEAIDLLQTLGTVPGFDRAARQLCGYGSPARDGALYELRIARAFAEKKMKVAGIRMPFKDDPAKRRTDIDLVVEHPAGRLIGIECKSGATNTDRVNADAVTLQHFVAKHSGARAAFSFGAKPTALAQKLLEIKGIAILSGSPKKQAEALWKFASAGEQSKSEP